MTTLQILIICLFSAPTAVVCCLIICGTWMRIAERRQGKQAPTVTRG